MLRLLAGARFQALFHSPPGVLFTFPSRYSCTVGRRVVLSLGGRSPLLPAGFLVPGGTPDCGPQARAFAYGALTLFRAPSHASSAGHVLCDCGRAVRGPDAASSTPGRQRPHALRAPRFGLAPVRSPLLGGSLFDFLSSGYLDVSVPPVASHCVGSRPSPAGFPHSGTPGSRPVCGSPGTIAACRALRRLPAPRHPPCALNTFGTLGPSGFRSFLCSLEKSLPLRAMRLSGCPACDSWRATGAGRCGIGGLLYR